MPQLPRYTAQLGAAPVSGGRRMSTPDVSAGAGFGATLAKGASNYLGDLEEKESREALVASSEIRAKYARELDAASLNGEDTDKLKEKLQDDLSKVGDNFQTKRGASSLQLYTSNTELMFDEQSNRIKVQRAAATARLEGGKFLNASSELIRTNPGYLPHAVDDAHAFAATLKNISPEQRAEIAQGLAKELNMAAAVSSARSDPEGTKKKLEQGEWDLTPQQHETAVGKADSEIRAKRADESYQRAVKEYEERERDDKARDKNFAAIMGGTASRRTIMDDADLKPATREHLIVFMEARARERLTTEKKSDPTVVRDLWLRIHALDSDPVKIYNGDAIFNAVRDGKVNTTDANNLNMLVANQKDENNRSIGQRLSLISSTAARAISADPQFTSQPALVAEIQNDYNARVLDKIAQLRKDNKPMDGVFTPGHKDYVGGREFIQASIDAAKQRQRDLLPKFPDLRAAPEAWKDVGVGATFIDPNGVQRVMTQETLNALSKEDARKVMAPKKAVPAAAEPVSERRQAQRGANEPLFPQ